MTAVLPLLALALNAVQPLGAEWQLVDVVSHKTYTVPHPLAQLRAGGVVDAAPAGAALTLHVTATDSQLRATISDRSGADRGLVVRFSLLLPPGAWRWWQDTDVSLPLGERTLSNTAGLRELPGLPEFGESARPDYGRYSIYPCGAVQTSEERTGGSWLALARPLDQLAIVRFTGLGGPQPRLNAEVDLALSVAGRQGREATITLCHLAGDGPRGLRQALARVPGLVDQEVRVKQFGQWMPFANLAGLPNVDEFGFAYQEGANNPRFDDDLGALSFVYFHCAGEFANIPGYQRGTKPLPPYDAIRQAFNAVAAEHSGVPDVWDICGIRDPEQKIAFRPEGTYGDFFCQACVDPALPYGRGMADRLAARVTATKMPTGIDGVYYDGIAAGLDYAPEHLRAATHPLLWDGKLGRPVNYNLLSSAAWAKNIWDRFTGTGKLTMLNDSSVVSFTFVGPWIDVPGAEMSIVLSRAEARQIRATVGRKPFCTLVKADFRKVSQAEIETYLRRCVAYGILPGFFDISPSGANPGSSYWEHPEWYNRDRALFRRYLPLAQELAAAGWQPDPQASCTGGFVERFGPADGLTYLTVSTDPRDDRRPQPVTVALDPALQAPGTIAVELLTGRIEPVGPKLVAMLTGEDLQVWALGSPAAQAAACRRRAQARLDGLRRYLTACQTTSSNLTPWNPYQSYGASLAAPGRLGGQCLKVARPAAKDSAGATQDLTLKGEKPRKMVLSAWAKAQNLTGATDRDCALYVDLYYTDHSALYGNVVPVKAGTHDWEYGEATIEPTKPLASAVVYLLMRGAHTGTVWFDDVRVAWADEPDRNLLRRGDFEPPTDRVLATRLDPRQPLSGTTLATLAKELTGDDHERLTRDLEELAWHTALADAATAGVAARPISKSRLTPPANLGQPAPVAVQREYIASGGRVPIGTVVTVDSLFGGYDSRPLTDGKINPPNEDWSRAAWASADTGSHWIELRFPRPAKVMAVKVWWATDNGQLQISSHVQIQTRVAGTWQRLGGAGVLDAKLGCTTFSLTGEALAGVRIFQPEGGGSTARPNLMWVSEVQVLP